MSPTTPQRRRHVTALLAGLCLLFVAATAAAQVCTHLDDPIVYSRENYRVREVKVEASFDFMHAVSNYLKEVKGKLPLQPGDAFRWSKLSRGRQQIEDSLDDAQKGADPRTRFRVITAQVKNCQEDPSAKRELDVVYHILLTNYDEYLSHTWELKSKEVERQSTAPAESVAESKAKGFLTVRPLAGYNRTRRGFGGGLLRMKLPGGFVESAEVTAVGSPTSNEEEFQLAGGSLPKTAALSRLEYKLFYKHSDVPAEGNRLREGRVSFQVLGASKPIGSQGVVLRFGSSLEGGNQQTDQRAAAAAVASAANSGYGGLKAYLGTTLRLRNVSLAGSYGIQLGTGGATTDLDFVKHLGELSITTQFMKRPGKPGEVHKAFTFESRLAGGRIQNRGLIPVTQRFFGGNVQRNFIEGDTWRMLSGPFIRSHPENRLNSSAASGDIGGTSFYSANFTLGREIWGYPLLPKDMSEDAEFTRALRASKVSIFQEMRSQHLWQDPAFAELARDIPITEISKDVTLRDFMKSLMKELMALPEKLPANLPEADRVVIVDEKADLLKADVGVFAESPDPAAMTEEQKRDLPKSLEQQLFEEDTEHCFTSDDDNRCSTLTSISIRLKVLADLLSTAGLTDDATRMRADAEALKPVRVALAARLKKTPVADKLAKADVKPLNDTLDALIDEVNVVSISPVAVFDVARVWPDRYGARYGAGGGLRLSFFNVNATLGYSFNLKRRPGDGRGALFFSLDFTDIFR